ncbi:hypothetical protein ACOQFV_20810 [Nocardiopsis changdeensis]|uniref:Protein kinase domain-containing protein n=1 Tax=Nocardiopsis changdeensis TaxID=2831969 RepID=A0ABX8BHM3_9ACTN|nr:MULTISPECIES: hypothetical protein [Nocardiopsis]QUX20849.1 hypothetical protein KGD84_20505 [Nocardiopsis changdeensis]QYX36781.1 hypothetical protein K1J57_29960 [Nocardiopsis sp. MT53]
MLPLHPHDPPSIGPYPLLGRLGEDGAARSYVGGTGDRAAVTIVLLKPARATDPSFRAEFARRVEALRKLKSRYVCAVADADTRGAVPWVAFVRPGEETLADLVEGNGGALAPQRFPTVATALARGLADLHAVAVPIGPLRAEDVLPAPGGAVFAGPVFAEPPEGEKGAVRHWAALMSSIAGEAGPPLRFRKVIDGCLHPDPDLRPNPRELANMLAGAAAEESAPRGKEGEEDAADGKRNGMRPLVPLAAGALAVTAAATTALVVSGGEPAEPAGTPEAVVTDCTEAEGFTPPEARSGGELDASHMAFSPDGDLLAVGTWQDGVGVWDWPEGREIARFHEGAPETGAVDFLPQGCTVAAVVPDPDAKEEVPPLNAAVFDLVAGTTTRHRLKEPARGTGLNAELGVSELAVSPDGLMALTGWSPDHTVSVIDGGTGEPVSSIDVPGNNPVFIDDQRLAVTELVSFDDWSITIWDARGGERLQTVRPASELDFAPIAGTDRIAYVRGDQIIVQDFVTGSQVDTFTMEGFADLEEPRVIELVVDPWLGRVYSTWLDNTPEKVEYHGSAWDMRSGEDVLPEGMVPLLVAPHPDGEVVAVRTEEPGVRLLDPETWEVVGEL